MKQSELKKSRRTNLKNNYHKLLSIGTPICSLLAFISLLMDKSWQFVHQHVSAPICIFATILISLCLIHIKYEELDDVRLPGKVKIYLGIIEPILLSGCILTLILINIVNISDNHTIANIICVVVIAVIVIVTPYLEDKYHTDQFENIVHQHGKRQ